MSRTITARAPGKLFLLGEYAVLDGTPAIVAAVDRHATVCLAGGASGPLRLEAPQLDAQLDVDVDRLPSAEGPFRFALAVLHALPAAQRASLLAGALLRISTEMTGEEAGKPGLGSSAAVTVAVAAALTHARNGRAVDTADRAEVFEWAWRAHRTAQGGVGSGADVAASSFGGVVHVEPAAEGPPVVTPLDWPRDLCLLAAHTRTSASTPDLVRSYLGLTNGHRAAREEFIRRVRAAVEGFRQRRAIEGIREAGEALRDLARAATLPIFTPALQALVDIARSCGAEAKPSGAGGGDCGIAVASTPAVASEVRRRWRDGGLEPLALGIARQGVVTHE